MDEDICFSDAQQNLLKDILIAIVRASINNNFSPSIYNHRKQVLKVIKRIYDCLLESHLKDKVEN